ncbi:MAG TPA: class I SAM-dependent methyltransferase [Gammaproteobacteria bacterium]|nr:class I SAM-dependent methyltransferase [Gammaproteobacteria bacterium]
MTGHRDWEARYRQAPCLFGDDPSPLLTGHAQLLQPGGHALAVGDGEGRNGVWLARRGLEVLSLDLSATALARARKRARQAGVTLTTCCSDALAWRWPEHVFDVVTLIFVHLPPAQRHRLHRLMAKSLRPGGLVFIEAYHRRQRDCASGGPADPDLLYTEAVLRRDFAGLEILKLEEAATRVVVEGEDRGEGRVVHFIAQA